MAKQYLDLTGLKHLWGLIGANFDAKGAAATAANAVVVEAGGDTYVDATAVADENGKIRKVTVKATETLTKAVTAANDALPQATYDTFVAGTNGNLKTNLDAVKVKADVGEDKLVTASADGTGRIITVGTTTKLQTAVSDLGLKDDDNAKDTAFGRIKKAEEDITSLKSSVSGGTFFKGVVDALPETSNPEYKNGDIVAIANTAKVNANKEFIYSGEATKGKWIELGDTTAEAGRITALENFNKSAFVNNPEGTATEKVKAALLADNATKAYGKTEKELLGDYAKTAAIAGTKTAQSGYYISKVDLTSGVLTAGETQLPVRSVEAGRGANGTILVNGSDVAVKGLKDAAFETKENIIAAAKDAGNKAYAVKGTEDKVKTLEGYFVNGKANSAAKADKIATTEAIGGVKTPVYVAANGTVTAGTQLEEAAYMTKSAIIDGLAKSSDVVANTTTVNGHALDANVTINAKEVSLSEYVKGEATAVGASDTVQAAIAKVEAKADSAISKAGVTSLISADKFVGVDKNQGDVKLTVTSTDADCTNALDDELATAKAVRATIETLNNTVSATAAKVDGDPVQGTQIDHVYVLTGVTETNGKLTGKTEVEFASMSNAEIDAALGL